MSNLWLSVITLILLFLLFIYSWRRQGVPGARVFAWVNLLFAVWVIGSILQGLSENIAVKIFWTKFQAVWQLPATTAVTCFLLEYSWPGKWLTRRNLALLGIVPLILLGLAVTDGWHHWMWPGFLVVNGSVEPVRGSIYWFFVAYAYGLCLVDFFIYAWLILHSIGNRWPVVFMLLGFMSSRAGYLLDQLDYFETSLPVNVLLIGFLHLMFAIGLFAFRMFDPIHQAGSTAITQMREAMLVLDPQNRIASLNPAALALLNVPKSSAIGRPVRELLDVDPREETSGTLEICQGSGPGARYYLLTSSSLKDWRGLVIGRLLLLTDITEQKILYGQMIERQKIQATYQERERMARELHDTLVQSTAVVRMQAETAGLWLERGEYGPVGATLSQIADTTQQMHLDLRQYIFEIRATVSAGQNFCDALRDELARFGQTWGLQTELKLPANLEQLDLSEALEYQVMRIVQESLTNIRKHAAAGRVTITFELDPRCLILTIEDDGRGFDTGRLSDPARGFGMKSMDERAREMGGTFEVHSAARLGTRVTLSIPIHGPGGEIKAHRKEVYARPVG